MELDNTANPETEIETPATEAETDAPELEAESTEADTDETEQLEQDEGDEFEEIEIDGKILKVSKDAKPYLMMDKDYRQKTMALADEKRELTAREQEIQQSAEHFQAYRDTAITVARMEAEIQELSSINFEQLAIENKPEADRLWYRLQMLQNERGNATQHLERLSHESREASERARANARERAVQALSKPDREFGWAGKIDQEVAKTLTEVGLKLGFSAQELAERDADPRVYKLINLARIGLQTLNKQNATNKPAAPQPRPVPQVGAGRAKGTVDPERMSPEAWVKWREAELAKKGRR